MPFLWHPANVEASMVEDAECHAAERIAKHYEACVITYLLVEHKMTVSEHEIHRTALRLRVRCHEAFDKAYISIGSRECASMGVVRSGV